MGDEKPLVVLDIILLVAHEIIVKGNNVIVKRAVVRLDIKAATATATSGSRRSGGSRATSRSRGGSRTTLRNRGGSRTASRNRGSSSLSFR